MPRNGYAKGRGTEFDHAIIRSCATRLYPLSTRLATGGAQGSGRRKGGERGKVVRVGGGGTLQRAAMQARPGNECLEIVYGFDGRLSLTGG